MALTGSLFGAACPERGTAAWLVVPHADTKAMTLHLAEIAKALAPGSHALLVRDGAGWHGAKRLHGPDNITLLPLPRYAPELNQMENVWQYRRANKHAITVFDTYAEILKKCSDAWNFFHRNCLAEPWHRAQTGRPCSARWWWRSKSYSRTRSGPAPCLFRYIRPRARAGQKAYPCRQVAVPGCALRAPAPWQTLPPSSTGSPAILRAMSRAIHLHVEPDIGQITRRCCGIVQSHRSSSPAECRRSRASRRAGL
ncbi:MAG: hypothetical protein GY717_19155 [Rhodobacteraceae bacterium]|nr:hypothetical protein [Paracoccaceae bacterium]